jgi:cytochrome c553
MKIGLHRVFTLAFWAFWFLTASLVHAGDVAAGRGQSIPCLACHGAEGISDHYLWPNIAGQSQGYLVKQLRDFRDGARHDPWMSPMTRNLSDEDIGNLADYFSSLPGTAGDGTAQPEKARTCAACHSAQMTAANSLWPKLAGQHQRYLVKQLKDYQAGRRADPVMAPQAKPLSDQDVGELAAYFAAQGGGQEK